MMRRAHAAIRLLIAIAAVFALGQGARADDAGPPAEPGPSVPPGAPPADGGTALPDGAAAPESSRPEADAGARDPNALTPPKLLTFVDAGYPDQARAEQREAAVLLQLTIAADGAVEEVVPIGEPAGHGFDELALAAARRFVFEPARKAGVPMRSRIQYRYEFRLQPTAAAPPSQAPPEARLAIALRSAEDDRPIAGAEILLSSLEDPTFARKLVSDEAGQASAQQLAAGSYELTLNHPRFTSERHTEQLTVDQATELTYRLEPAQRDDEYGAVARVKAPPREVTRRTIEREELTRVAGTRGDALRTIELLPGVARPPFGSGQVLIRGAGPGDSQIMLDGVPVPLLYHFGGLTSFINSRALDRIDFYPGNFSARYGRAMGGIVDVGVRDPSSDRYHAMIDTNLPLDSSLLVEGPIGEKTSFLLAGRRSYLGEILTATIPEDSVGSLAAPVYFDYQAFVSYRPTDRDRFRFGGYGSSDRLEVLFAENDDDPAVQGVELGLSFHRAQLAWKRQYSAKLEHDVQLSYGRILNEIRLPPTFTLDLKFNNFYLRAEWLYRVNDKLHIIAGTDSQLTDVQASYVGPVPSDSEDAGDGASFGQRPQIGYDNRGTVYQPAAYLELAIMPMPALRIVPGVRVDYTSTIDRFSINPRLATIYSLTKDWRIKAGVGLFSQSPEPPQDIEGIGTRHLGYNQALHYGAGVEHDFTDDLSLGLEGFYKTLYNRVVSTDFETAAVDSPPFENDGIGRVYGLEVAGRKQAKGRWFGFLSYTLMRSERKDHNDPWRLFSFDQTHILSLASTVLLGKGWELGATLRVVSGNPYTPIVGASFDQDTGMYTPEYGRLNSRRAPTFNRLDLRAQKTWRFQSWRLALYLDVQNSYNAVNREGVTYNYNYKEDEKIRGIPILPVLGLRGEL